MGENQLKSQKFYLAHPIKDRHEIREWEKKVEERFGINLLNPFYDAVEIGNIKEVDEGVKGVYDAAFDSAEIVEGDLDLIRRSDGVVAFLTNNISIGTNMEIFYNAYVLKKPTHIIVEHPELIGHSWLRHMTSVSPSRIYPSREDFVKTFLEKSI